MHKRDLPGFLHTFFTSFEAVGQPLAVPLELGAAPRVGGGRPRPPLGFRTGPPTSATPRATSGEWTDTSRITFGRDGVPFYLSGPYDNPRSVVRTLDRTCGEGKYHYGVGQGWNPLTPRTEE